MVTEGGEEKSIGEDDGTKKKEIEDETEDETTAVTQRWFHPPLSLRIMLMSTLQQARKILKIAKNIYHKQMFFRYTSLNLIK